MNFPELIEKVRKKLGENQTTFGKRFGVSHASVCMWENGKCKADYAVLSFCLELDEKPSITIGPELIESFMLVEIYARIHGYLPDMQDDDMDAIGIPGMCKRYLRLCGHDNKYPYDEYYMLAIRKTS